MARGSTGGCESVGGNTAQGEVSVTPQVSGRGLSVHGPVQWMPGLRVRGAASRPVPPCQTLLAGELQRLLISDHALHALNA